MKKAEKKKILSSEKILKTVTAQLANALSSSLKKHLGEKEFNKRIKKAAKKLVAGVKHKAEKKTAVKKKKAAPVKKKATKAAVK